MRVNDTYDSVTRGVSTLAPRNRVKGYADSQINFRSDPVKKLTRKPSLIWGSVLASLDTIDWKYEHAYLRGGIEYRLLISDDGDVKGFVNDIEKPVTGDLDNYVNLSDSIVMKTIKDTTFVTNPEITVAMTAATEVNSIEKVTHVNIVSAMNYSETIKLTIILEDDTELEVEYKSDNVSGDDESRATNTAADELALAINNITGLSAIVQGSSIAIWRTDLNEWVTVKVSSGQGTGSVVAVNKKIESIEGLPLYAVHGTRITVQPDPTSTSGIYYLDASSVEDDPVTAPTPADRVMSEVVWTEARSPEEAYQFELTSMPRTIVYDNIADEFTAGVPSIGWDEREAGDDNSVKVPKFVGQKIKAIEYMHNRLVFLAGNDVVMSRTDNLYNFWKASATQLVVSDPIGISSSSAETDELSYLIMHNRDLLAIASDGQFKVDGSTAVTPENAALPRTTQYEVQTTVEPVSMGNAVYLPISYGTSSGLQEYTGERDTMQDKAEPISHGVIGYVEGSIKLMTASPNLEMIAMVAENSNEIVIYDQYTQNQKRVQAAWSKWTIPETSEIMNIRFRSDSLTVICRENGNLVVKYLDLYQKVGTTTGDVYLDDYLELDTDGLTATVPDGYVIDDTITVVRGEGCRGELQTTKWTADGNVLTFPRAVSTGAAKVMVGRTFRSEYSPTRPFVTFDNEEPNEHDRVRVNRFVLHLEDTHSVTMEVEDEEPYEFISRILGSALASLGNVTTYSGPFKFPFGGDVSVKMPTFSVEDHLSCNIIGIDWVGQYYKRGRSI